MSYDREAPKKLPHKAEVFQLMEDRLRQIQSDLRELRTRMADAKMDVVELKLGTFQHCLDRMEPYPKQFLGEFDKQRVVRDVINARDKMRENLKGRPSKKK